jgi:hypothetical protein
MYPHRAYIETLLSYGPAAKESQLTDVMWYKDTLGQQDKKIKLRRSWDVTQAITNLFGSCPKNILS